MNYNFVSLCPVTIVQLIPLYYVLAYITIEYFIGSNVQYGMINFVID